MAKSRGGVEVGKRVSFREEQGVVGWGVGLWLWILSCMSGLIPALSSCSADLLWITVCSLAFHRQITPPLFQKHVTCFYCLWLKPCGLSWPLQKEVMFCLCLLARYLTIYSSEIWWKVTLWAMGNLPSWDTLIFLSTHKRLLDIIAKLLFKSCCFTINSYNFNIILRTFGYSIHFI